MANLLFGITGSGVIHTDADDSLDLGTKFRTVRESGVCDYFDKQVKKEHIPEVWP
ncbi:MAG: hypothetical protein QGF67_04585 [Lentisphaeria bacterium]|jgi:hypothetical protein|nr:hypothetical protein [Lentisphaeria bacterium]